MAAQVFVPTGSGGVPGRRTRLVVDGLVVGGDVHAGRSGPARKKFTPNRVVRNCELLAIGLTLFLRKIDHDDLGVFT